MVVVRPDNVFSPMNFFHCAPHHAERDGYVELTALCGRTPVKVYRRDAMSQREYGNPKTLAARINGYGARSGVSRLCSHARANCQSR